MLKPNEIALFHRDDRLLLSLRRENNDLGLWVCEDRYVFQKSRLIPIQVLTGESIQEYALPQIAQEHRHRLTCESAPSGQSRREQVLECGYSNRSSQFAPSG